VFSVALVGADGAGKTTVGRRLHETLPLPTRSIYMGVNLEASRLVLPTTWLLLSIRRARGTRPDLVASTDPRTARAAPSGPLRRAATGAKSALRLCNWLAEEAFRHSVASYHRRRGRIVVLDRSFYHDYYAYDVAPNGARSPARRIHGFFLERVYPKPDLVICLDAPAEVLYARKPEAPVEWLERRRAEYLDLARVAPNFVVVDAARPLAEVEADVEAAVLGFHSRAAAVNQAVPT
jgi:thymidylate kinase